MSETHALPDAEPIDLTECVSYAEDSIVSKTLVNRKTGTLTAFAFAAGQQLSEHTAPFDAVVQILDGEAELTIGGKMVAAGSGTLVKMPANVPHALKAVRPFKMLLTMIRS